MMNITRNRAKIALAVGAWIGLSASHVFANVLELPSNAQLTREEVKAAAVYSAPIAPYASGLLPVFEVSGRVAKQAFRIPQDGLTPQQILSPIEENLQKAGFEALFKCQDSFCGGFDFRFSTEVLPAPDMHVDLFDFTFVTARRDDEYITLLASRDSAAGYLQVIQVSPDGKTALPLQASGAQIVAETPKADLPNLPSAGVTAQLERRGRAILEDLTFKTGSANLGDETFDSLAALARYLKDNPSRKIALVGHTDSTGGLDVNIAISKRRAASVLERLASAHGIPRSQMEADGIGYLAPLASNLTEAGRETNRRVEAILLSTE